MEQVQEQLRHVLEQWEVQATLQEPQDWQGALPSAQNCLGRFQEGLKAQNHQQSPSFTKNPCQESSQHGI
jgi:hypothetical protein